LNTRGIRNVTATQLDATRGDPHCSSVVACGARAQQSTDDTGTQALQEVVVTSQRREEKLQDVPIAVTAFAADQLQARGISNIKVANNIDFGPSFGNLTVGYFTEPRTYGVEARVRW